MHITIKTFCNHLFLHVSSSHIFNKGENETKRILNLKFGFSLFIRGSSSQFWSKFIILFLMFSRRHEGHNSLFCYQSSGDVFVYILKTSG